MTSGRSADLGRRGAGMREVHLRNASSVLTHRLSSCALDSPLPNYATTMSEMWICRYTSTTGPEDSSFNMDNDYLGRYPVPPPAV